MTNSTHLFFDPFYALIRGIRENRKQSHLQSVCTGIPPVISFYWEVKGFFQTRPALIECKIVLHEYVESIPQAIRMEAASCLLDELTRLRGVIKAEEAEQEAHLRAAYPLLSSGGIKTREHIEQFRQFDEDRDNDCLLDAVPDILEYLDEIMREPQKILYTGFESPDMETVSNLLQDGRTLEDFRANERRLFRDGLVDHACRWIGKKTLFQSYATVLLQSDYFIKRIKWPEQRKFFERRYDPGEIYLKPGDLKNINKAREDFPWIRDQTVMKR
jgi:hypothetical protein